MPGKRANVISWDEFFMRVAIAASLRSKDPNTQVGACIADTNHRILSVGYNGTPSGIDDDEFPWGANEDPLFDKHKLRHARRGQCDPQLSRIAQGHDRRYRLRHALPLSRVREDAGAGWYRRGGLPDDKYDGTEEQRGLTSVILDTCNVGYRPVRLTDA